MATKNKIIIVVLLAVVLIFIFSVQYVIFLRKAHSTFANYFAFRGCEKLLNKTDDYGICQTASGQTIKIVKFDNRWFLDGDLPCGFLCF